MKIKKLFKLNLVSKILLGFIVLAGIFTLYTHSTYSAVIVTNNTKVPIEKYNGWDYTFSNVKGTNGQQISMSGWTQNGTGQYSSQSKALTTTLYFYSANDGISAADGDYAPKSLSKGTTAALMLQALGIPSGDSFQLDPTGSGGVVFFNPLELDEIIPQGNGNQPDVNALIYYVYIANTPNSSGNIPWVDGDGTAVTNLSTIASRLKFISPTVIYDSKTRIYYTTDGTNQFINSGQHFLDDGDTVYWPADGVQHGDKCYGGITVQTDLTVYVQVRTLPTTYTDGTCSVGYAGDGFVPVSAMSSSLSGAPYNYTGSENVGVHFRNNYFTSSNVDPSIQDALEGINWSGPDSSQPAKLLKLSQSSMQMEFSMFYWSDSKQILLWGNYNNDTLTPVANQKQVLAAVGKPANSSWVAFSSCTDSVYAPLLVVNMDQSKSIGALNTTSSSVTGYFYTYNANSSSNSWSQSKLNCLFAGGAPQYNFNVEQPRGFVSINSSDGYTYISFPKNSLSSTPVSISGGTPQPGPEYNPAGLNANTASCQVGLDNPLSWVLCPVFNMITDLSSWLLHSVISTLLTTPPLQFNGGSSYSKEVYSAWSNFRVYGNIVLLIAFLIIIYSESIGGELISAYTVKKMLPRILFAAILLNLSIYIVAGMIDIGQILGQGISGLLTAPFQSAGIQDFHFSIQQGLGILGFGIMGLFFAGASIATFVGAILSGAGTDIMMAALFLALPVILGVVAIFITLIIRNGLILILLIVSPIAFALYALPNTEQYFRRWWKLLLETLMIYPIIMLIAGASSILSTTTLLTADVKSKDLSALSNGSLQGLALNSSSDIAIIIAFFLQFMPLLAVPFAFRIAGGVLGRVNEFLQNGAKQINKMAEERKHTAYAKYRDAGMGGRNRMYNWLNKRASTEGAVGRRTSKFFANRVGGHDFHHAMSVRRAEVIKDMEDTIATGIDDEIRGLTVNKALADKTAENDMWRMNNGVKQYKTLGGAWVDEAAVDAGYERWGHNEFAQQEALSYEMRKTDTEEQMASLASNFHNLQQSWGMNDFQMAGIWKGAAFANQNQHLEYKHADWTTGQTKGEAFVNEAYEKKGSYALAQMGANTITELANAYDEADRGYNEAYSRGDTAAMARHQATKQKVVDISETFMHTLGQQGLDDTRPITDAETTGGVSTSRTINTPGAASVAQRVRMLATKTGVMKAPPGVAQPTTMGRPGQAPSGTITGTDKRREQQ